MFETFRERLHLVQQDFTSGLKTLGDRSRDTKTRQRSRLEVSSPHFTAGLEVLSRYEDSWFLLHKRTKDCAQAAEAADGDVVMLSAHWERRRAALTQLQEQLQSLPAFIGDLDAITANLAHLEGDFEEIESRLVHLETLCGQCEQQMSKRQNISKLEDYKKKKRGELEALQVDLSSQHARNLTELEQAMQQKMRERQKVYEDAFNRDMKRYLSTGCLQRRQSSSEADECALDLIAVDNLSDQEALDDFLNSTDDDISAGSSLTSGPDPESSLSESVRSQMALTPPTSSSQSNQSAEWEQVEEGLSDETGEHLVQSDEEDVQPGASPTGTHDVGRVRVSNE